MINRLDANCEERGKELWILPGARRLICKLITIFKLMKQYFMSESEQLYSFILRTRRP